MKLEDVGLKIPEIMLPGSGYDRWAIVACDQYTSQIEMWHEMEKDVAGKPSTLNLMLPEVYLEDDDVIGRQKDINTNMQTYLDTDVFKKIINSMVYVKRQTSTGTRLGLVTAVNLDEYDYHADSTALIRSTEETIADRLPPRVKIRSEAPLEMPHIMILIDDAENTVIKPLDATATDKNKLYDFDLMTNGGNIKGYIVDEQFNTQIANALYNLKVKNDGLLYAMGDGNHSLATAKECWENLKSEGVKDSLAKHALVEIVNLHDAALSFEPIHRVLYNCTKKSFEDFVNILSQNSPDGEENMVSYMFAGTKGEFSLSTEKLEVNYIEEAVDKLLLSNPEVRVDYVHGDDVALSLGQKEDTLSIILPTFNKKMLFTTVEKFGQLPRKSFSMGHAQDKRYYIECRRIKD
ncbi:MAG: DUF1015 domain-containing protein [Clostridiales bacterium]|nr:DUF1015 domain-containing protein [Clostridiales bacterium]